MSSSIDDLNSSMFRPRIGETFILERADGNLEMELAEVDDLPPATRRPNLKIRQNPFSLIFKNHNSEITIDQGNYMVTHDELQPIQMFVVPVGFGEYQVIFN